MTKKLINLAKIDFAGNAEAAPAPAPSADADVVLRDYDGSVVASYTKEEFAALTELPAPPEHEGLTFQEWNWSLENAQAYCARYGMVDIGATYITSDGKTRIHITLTEGRTSPTLGLGVNGSVDIDWGDDSEHSTLSGSNISTLVSTTHDYVNHGDYVITLTPAEGTTISVLGNAYRGSSLVTSTDNLRLVYNNAVKSLFIGGSVTSIGSYAFQNCYSLTSINIPKGVTSIGSNAFQKCHSLSSIVIPEGVTSIGSNTFQTCSNLSSIVMPEGVTSIGSDEFYECSSLSSIVIPEGVTSIGSDAFRSCYSLSSIVIPDRVTSIGNDVFRDCLSLSSIVIPIGVTSIGSNAFWNCFSLSSIVIPGRVTSINTGTFVNCSSLSSIVIPEGVTSIGNGVFSGCPSLSSIVIPEGVTSIGYTAFYNCYGMKYYYVEALTPPAIQNNTISGIPSDAIIYVPAESVEAYKAATNWSAYASQIQAMP